MISTRRLFIIFILSTLFTTLILSECNFCASTRIACVSETQYQFCVNSIPTGSINTCPGGTVCSTVMDIVCQPAGNGFGPSCTTGCNVCSASGVFACTGVNTYALCLGSNIISSIAQSCGTLVCNVDLPQICGDATTTAATCSATATTTTTPWTPSLTTPTTLPSYAAFLCQQIRINARFTLPSDTTCKRYIYCFLPINSTWSGQIYTCAGSTYFDPYSRYCVANRPAGCSLQS